MKKILKLSIIVILLITSSCSTPKKYGCPGHIYFKVFQ